MSWKRICTICAFSLCLPVAFSHMQMDNPFPLRSPLDPDTPSSLKDYNMVAPLNPSGNDFTCKGYQWNTPWRSTTTYTAGQTYNMSVTGGATHGGGSCQLSLSYDKGITFKVIKSIIGGCPLRPPYDFTIPEYAPSGQALFAWTWYNRVGNREMYMNCAVVDIVGDDSPSHRRETAMGALAHLPDIWVANLAGINSCRTTENADPVFPNPGPDVVYGNDIS
ncbi:lytic polysaccharide monooxygenase, partial [Lepidopterella palustris CBS 459.81]